jgi:hypothetical protein
MRRMHVKKYGSWDNWDPTLRDMLGSFHALLSLSLSLVLCILHMAKKIYRPMLYSAYQIYRKCSGKNSTVIYG